MPGPDSFRDRRILITGAGTGIGATTAKLLAARGARIATVLKGIAITPLRYGLMVADTLTILRFATDLWITGNRKWRK